MTHQDKTLEVFVTGGTFDKKYNYLNGELYFDESHVPEMFKRGRCTLNVKIRTIMMMDSLQMKSSHRDIIAEHCRISSSDHIVITHGTDTMVETAAHIAAAAIVGKTIVLTGAIIPYKFGSSDGFFNLGSAVAFAQTLMPGVYIAMNGRYFRWDSVRKNTSNGYFEEVESVQR